LSVSEPISESINSATGVIRERAATDAIEALFKHVVRYEGSDLFISADQPPTFRVDGHVQKITNAPTPAALTQRLFESILSKHQQEQFVRTGEVDTALDMAGIGRFRVNVFSHRGQLGYVFRHLRSSLPDIASLRLPVAQLEKLARLRRGIVLVTGTAGSGKSTTLASMIHFLNRNEARHIVTLEDPVEFLFESQRCTIHQREVGVDTLSFAAALKHIVRQSPDVIMVGEMRDRDTVESTMHAAETGHLVFSTLHTVNAAQTVERIVSFFTPEQHSLVRSQLGTLLEGVVSQRLLPCASGNGRVPAVELMLSTPTISEMIANGRTGEIRAALRDGAHHFGTQTFNQSIVELVRGGLISVDEALAASDDPDEIQMDLRGFSRGSRGRAVFDGQGFSSATSVPPVRPRPAT
jgi:twitching motility protein PilT